jgi:DNA polymerase I-like protein with 3'-5' exonuclease and polymerase domains
MSPGRVEDELYFLLKPNRIQRNLRKKIGVDALDEDIFINYTNTELDEINKQRVQTAIQTNSFTITKKNEIDIRDPFKNVVYGIFYGATEDKIANTLNIAPYYAKLILDGMREALPELFKYLDSVARFGVKNGYIIFNKRTNSRHIFQSYLDAKQQGRELTFGEKGAIERFCKNVVMSGTQADMIKESMVEVQKYVKSIYEIPQDKFRWKLQVHDELVYMFKNDHLPETIGKIVTDTCNLYLEPNIRMKISTYVGIYWNK